MQLNIIRRLVTWHQLILRTLKLTLRTEHACTVHSNKLYLRQNSQDYIILGILLYKKEKLSNVYYSKL